MNGLGARIALEATQLIGVRFQLHGRTECSGLDCVGLVALALSRARPGEALLAPRSYGLRNTDISQHLEFVNSSGLVNAEGEIQRGDIVHTKPSVTQDHLLVAVGQDAFVHAHAGLRCVVLTKGLLSDEIAHHWRANPY